MIALTILDWTNEDMQVQIKVNVKVEMKSGDASVFRVFNYIIHASTKAL